MSERVLLISYAYPPIAAPEAILSAKAARSISFPVDVVAAAPAAWMARDESLVSYGEEAANRVVRVDPPVWIPLVQPLRSVRQFPDAMRFLHRRTLSKIAALDPAQYDVVHTWSQWHSVHLVGLSLKRSFPAVRWVAHFSDPWSDNPLANLGRSGRRMARRWEADVIAEADAVIFTASHTRDLVMQKYPSRWQSKAVVVPHLFDPELYPSDPCPSVRGRGVVARHIGSFYGARQPAPLLQALAAMDSRGELANTHVELIGRHDRATRSALGSSGLSGRVVRLKSAVAYTESLRLMTDSDLLLLIDAPAARSVYLPSKLIDYIGAGRPILGITPEGEAADVIRDLGGWVAHPDDVDGVREMAGLALSAARNRATTQPWGAPSVRAMYQLENVGRMREEVLRRHPES